MKNKHFLSALPLCFLLDSFTTSWIDRALTISWTLCCIFLLCFWRSLKCQNERETRLFAVQLYLLEDVCSCDST